MLSSTTSVKKITRSKRQRYFTESVIDRRNADYKKNVKTVRDRTTAANMRRASLNMRMRIRRRCGP